MSKTFYNFLGYYFNDVLSHLLSGTLDFVPNLVKFILGLKYDFKFYILSGHRVDNSCILGFDFYT